MIVTGIRHNWPEKAGFFISRPEGLEEYTFLHFTTAVQFRLGDQLIQARPGACIFYSPQTPQWFRSSQSVIHNWMHTDGSLRQFLQQYDIPVNTLLYPHTTDFISEIFQRLEIEFFSDNPYRAELMEGFVKEFIIKFSRSLQPDIAVTKVQRRERYKLTKLRQHILSHPEHRWTVAEMAGLASLSASRFHAVYKSVFGTSPLQDVIEAKISYAKSLLLSDEQPTLRDVAEMLGYNDQYHFIRQFKSVTGETPGAFRKARQ